MQAPDSRRAVSTGARAALAGTSTVAVARTRTRDALSRLAAARAVPVLTMPAFPIFNHLSTEGYGLYPGTKQRPDMDIDFKSGMTLVLGANGLGKTTLVILLYRMCTGPFDIPGLGGASELGDKKLDAVRLSASQRRVLSDRVNDGAKAAVATIVVTLGGVKLQIERNLSDLSLLSLQEDGTDLAANEAEYQKVILRHARLNTFGEWVLLLRHITFYFEERRSLVWDPTAQRQLLRLLFLAPEASAQWAGAERDVLQRDSAMRNFRAVLTKEEKTLASAETAVESQQELRASLSRLERAQARDQPRLSELNDEAASLSAEHEGARLAAIRAESEQESAYRNLERLQLQAIARAFPSADETARYLLGKLIADEECLACGTRSPDLAAQLRQRITQHRCIVCNSEVSSPRSGASSKRALTAATAALHKANERCEAAARHREQTKQMLDGHRAEVARLSADVTERSAQIEELASRLPPGEAALHEQRRDLAAMRSRLDTMRAEHASRRAALARLIEQSSREIVERREAVQTAFSEFARGFLLEQCSLAWAPHRTQVGETGAAIDFPAFELEMTGSDFSSPMRRQGPQQVSESQREFIDLAFRMALIDVAGSGGIGTIVIDAPESSLDAVFVTRAADVLVRYASSPGNRLIITSNLIEGNLIPELIRKGNIRSSTSDRIVDLLTIAAPTAATSMLKDEYAAVRRALFKRATK